MEFGSGFRRDELRRRYEVTEFHEDDWHTHTGRRSSDILSIYLGQKRASSGWLLNAGAGVYRVSAPPLSEVSLDLFSAPILQHPCAVCGRIEQIPFASTTFDLIICIGEVLGYSDPARSIAEFSRVIKDSGVLICDFSSSRSFTYWLKKPYRRSADIVTTTYNGTVEKFWIYDPEYIFDLLEKNGFKIKEKIGIHAWSALARRLGGSDSVAIYLEELLIKLKVPSLFPDLITVVAEKIEAVK